ncbi:MAG: 3-methyl-2-oxobutanoate hydroxymethyltransferase [Gammaproteobacteria bacterium]
MKSVLDFQKMKEQGQPITMVTCYDFSFAKIIEETDIDCVLVGDSSAMVMHGHDNTTAATVAMITAHTQAVTRGLRNKFIIADLPFLSYRQSRSETCTVVAEMLRAGAQAIKLEGATGNLAIIRHLVQSGVPVMGHLGLTPQFIHALGGHKVQGRDEKTAENLLQQAQALERAGAFALVLECIPQLLAKRISESLSIPTIGIGAGPHTDGQVLVLQDLLGLQCNTKPKFLKTYLNGFSLVQNALNDYVKDVKNRQYPEIETHSY